ncbi:synaptotagmin-3-like isoform X2 [Mangifera indica]|uniref:synaptotagmin-3-like isoform X2 n=1 Tax=Mangifera indica TaxID=29780 RepID=UPI001CF996AF|nr:synaptotagmin-3-like isoform X2 [Mangifera indica]XP_044479852.1 synaptotagmin-3-like isoform X2 [Mangifera indica]
MGFVSSLLGILGFVIGIPVGLLVGFFFFVYSKPDEVEDPEIKPLAELDNIPLYELLPEIPYWIKSPDFDRVDWLNKFLCDMWPYLDKAICSTIRNMAQPIFAEYIGMYKIQAIEFENLTLGTLPPTIHGIRVYETNEKELVMEPAMRWAGNPNTVLVIKLLSLQIGVQLVDLQIFATPRLTLKPLVPAFPCFGKIAVTLMEKPHIDFGVKVLGGDIMSIPGLYHFIQKSIQKYVASLYLWPLTFEIPILDDSTIAIKKPVGILRVKVVRAMKLLKKDLIGTSDPYVKLNLTGEKLSSKKTSIKKRNLNPEWNENFKLAVKEPQSQVLQLQVFDWDKVGRHDRLGQQLVPLKLLTPHETKEFTLDLLKHTNITDPKDKTQRGKIVVELTYVPFREDSYKFGTALSEKYSKKGSGINQSFNANEQTLSAPGLLSITVQGAEDVEGERHSNPYALVLFRGEKKKTKMIKKCHNPLWNEEFQFMLEEAPLQEKIHIEVISKRTGFSFRSSESLGHVEINLADVVHNGRINEKYHLINSKNGIIHVEIQWTTV